MGEWSGSDVRENRTGAEACMLEISPDWKGAYSVKVFSILYCGRMDIIGNKQPTLSRVDGKWTATGERAPALHDAKATEAPYEPGRSGQTIGRMPERSLLRPLRFPRGCVETRGFGRGFP